MKRNADKTVRKTIESIIAIALLSFLFIGGRDFFRAIAKFPFIAAILGWFHALGVNLSATPIVGKPVQWFLLFKHWLQHLGSLYFMNYFNAFLLVFFLGALVALAGLKWRINFYRALNVILSVLIRYPLLVIKYFSGYQTPIKDEILSGVLEAKIRENLNDSYERAIDDLDDRGKKFQDGAGGTAATQTKKATAVAIRRATVTVKTAAGQRKAHLLVKQSRETETDRSIENSLKGLGVRMSGDSIYFPSDPTYSQTEKGYVFDSVVSYSPAKELGSFLSIFSNPFDQQNKVDLGGKGTFAVFKENLKNLWAYIRHCSPIAVHDRLIEMGDELTKKKAKSFESNLDLSVIPEPKDHDTGNTIEEQRKLSLQKANDRIADVKAALNSLKLSGQFLDVQVGGSTAIYRFALPPDPKLPSDFNKVQEQLANMLHINEIPIITLKAGVLNVSVNNGVNIPVSFVDMVKKNKPSKNVIHGMLGTNAMGEPIYFDLGDKVPHASIYGKTGTGKTVTIFTILYSIMSQTDPKHLKMAFCDGKGNSFEFMKLDGDSPNPYLYAPPADASGDIDYARALIHHIEKETRRRIDLFKHAQVAKLSEYNEKCPDKQLPEILFVCDEFSAITGQDKDLKASELNEKGTVDTFAYIAKMARSTGIRMILANQTARKEQVPGIISANLPGHVSLGVTEPIEAEIALPETGIKLNLISQPGEFYSTMNGTANPEHGNSPYIPQSVANELNRKLTEKFGKPEYVKTREQIMEETGFAGDKAKNDNSPKSAPKSRLGATGTPSSNHIRRSDQTSQMEEYKRMRGNRPTGKFNIKSRAKSAIGSSNVISPKTPINAQTDLDEIYRLAKEDNGKYIPYLKANREIIQNNQKINSPNDLVQKQAHEMIGKIEEQILLFDEVQKKAENTRTHPHTGEIAHRISGGQNGPKI